MTAPAEFIDQMLRMLRGQFYADNAKGYFQQQNLLKKALTELASFLFSRGVSLPQDRYQAILMDIIQTIKRHGATDKIQFFGGYFLHSVQRHIVKHGHEYYAEGLTIRNAVENAMLGIQGAQKVPRQEDSTIERLAELNALLKAGANRRPRGSKKSVQQLGFLSLCWGFAALLQAIKICHSFA
jgi:hypothetical protein